MNEKLFTHYSIRGEAIFRHPISSEYMFDVITVSSNMIKMYFFKINLISLLPKLVLTLMFNKNIITPQAI